MNWKLTWIVIVAMPVLVFSRTNRKCKLLLRKCGSIANELFVQEECGMKIVQLFNREKLKPRKIQKILTNIEKLG
jgi:hypothetical protein